MSEGVQLVLSVPQGVTEALAKELIAEVQRALATPISHDPWRLWDLRETAKRLGRSERWVRTRVKQGDIPRIRLDGGALMFDPDDVRRFARNRRVPGEKIAAAGDGVRLLPTAVERSGT